MNPDGVCACAIPIRVAANKNEVNNILTRCMKGNVEVQMILKVVKTSLVLAEGDKSLRLCPAVYKVAMKYASLKLSVTAAA